MTIPATDPPGLSASFADVWERHHQRITRWLMLKTGNPAIADDLASEVFARAWAHWADFDNRDVDSKVGAWLNQIAGRLLIDHYRSAASRNKSLDARTNPFADHDPTTVGDMLPNPLADIDTLADRLTDAEAIRKAARGDLPMLLALFWQGVTYEEMQDKLGCSAGALRIRVHRFRNRLHAIA